MEYRDAMPGLEHRRKMAMYNEWQCGSIECGEVYRMP